MPLLDLTEEEHALVILMLRQLIELDPLSPHADTLKRLLEKLQPAKSVAVPETASTG